MPQPGALEAHLAALGDCSRCPQMLGPPVHGLPVRSRVMLVGQAPGDKERDRLRPFTWTAGKRLFSLFDTIGLAERDFRRRVYMAAVCRCFPGKLPRGGDRVPERAEIKNCRAWLDAELDLLRPGLIILVGKLAIAEFMPVKALADVVGSVHTWQHEGRCIDLVPLPHPSGASTWIHRDPGKTLLARALQQLESHPEWQALLTSNRAHDGPE